MAIAPPLPKSTSSEATQFLIQTVNPTYYKSFPAALPNPAPQVTVKKISGQSKKEKRIGGA